MFDRIYQNENGAVYAGLNNYVLHLFFIERMAFFATRWGFRGRLFPIGMTPGETARISVVQPLRVEEINRRFGSLVIQLESLPDRVANLNELDDLVWPHFDEVRERAEICSFTAEPNTLFRVYISQRVYKLHGRGPVSPTVLRKHVSLLGTGGEVEALRMRLISLLNSSIRDRVDEEKVYRERLTRRLDERVAQFNSAGP